MDVSKWKLIKTFQKYKAHKKIKSSVSDRW